MAKTYKQLKSEYSKVASEINRRIGKLEKERPTAVSIERYKGVYRPASRLTKNTTATDLRNAIRKGKELLKSGELSLEDKERQFATGVNTLRDELGLDVTEENARDYFNFLDDARQRGLINMFRASEPLLEIYDEVGESYSDEKLLAAIERGVNRGLTVREIQSNVERWARNKPTRLYIKGGSSRDYKR